MPGALATFYQGGPMDAMARLVRWHKRTGPLSLDEGETPAEAYVRKMP